MDKGGLLPRDRRNAGKPQHAAAHGERQGEGQMLSVGDRGGVRMLTLDRPEVRNALNLALIRALRAALAQAKADGVRCLVIAGNGKAFSAGGDVAEWVEVEARGESATFPWVDEMHGLMLDIAGFPAPSIACLNGAAVGAGLDMALACDFRLAADSARFQCAYTRMAICPDAGGSWLLPRLVGLEQAKRFAFTAEFWSAAEALARGLVTQVHAADALAAAAQSFAERLAAGPSVAIRETKRLMETAAARDLRAQLAEERTASERCYQTEDFKEAMAAATEKRAPVFRGR
jgi:2-(1,2-epoxy-1,2-dihydrophenyl)acetyl-CoA isomerase